MHFWRLRVQVICWQCFLVQNVVGVILGGELITEILNLPASCFFFMFSVL